ncbi:MAG: 5-formyltetrahydrofolate cyclo-ligase [Oscillospiraceae bacterium]
MNLSEIAAEKIRLRDEIKSRIRALSPEYLAESDLAIFQSLLSLPEFISAPRVFAYFSIGHEVDTRRLIQYCEKIGKPLALPVDLTELSMSFALIDCPLENLPRGLFNIPEPRAGALRASPNADDIILVPALCYDSRGYRLGRGGGYYDRFLASCPAFSLGLCREALLVPKVPTEDFDLSVNCLISDKRIARPN